MGKHPLGPGARPGPRTARLLCLPLLALIGLLLLLAGAGPAGAAESGGEGVRGTLTNAGMRVPGVTIRAERDGRPAGQAVSDARGAWRIELTQGPGVYTVVLDEATLPPGVSLREAGANRREVNVRPGSVAPALFVLGEATTQPKGKGAQALQLLVDGLQYGLVIAMAAIGLSLIFGTTGLTNFAHGELVTGGAILAYVFNVLGLNLIPATLLAVIGAGLLGGLLDRGLWRPLRGRGTGLVAALVVSIGLSLVLRYLYLYLFGGASRSYEQYATQGPIVLGPVSVTPRDLVIMAVAIVVLTGVGLGLQRTRIGKATRAVADNPSLAASSGIDVERVINVVWVAGAALAALGGVFLSLTQQVNFINGFNLLLLMFAGVTLGGLGTAFGALVGSLVIGIFTQLSTLVIPSELQQVGALAILILVLIVRPQGILGRAERVG